ncbi:alpha/beta-hydrolase [Pholiota conissans]|uniref:Alpha/beta-hydrolase n=1 Tax=Pholiota conissans TaxID=109636 RepID=A0A9P5ZBR7_9AGAR|nr:alpha/beta-hydrolase [Pholiota conissans]
MSPNTPPAEKYLDLPDGRILAYADSGNHSSSSLVLFFHGVFNVGEVRRMHTALSDREVHYVAPTLPAWGKSSPIPKHIPYHIALATDVTALIEHLHPNDPNLKIYISGGSFGTVPAQMLYGAPFDIFPLGRRVAGCMLIAPISPLKLHKDCAKSMSTITYFSIGPPSQYIPFRLVQRLSSAVFKKATCTIEGAEAFLRAQMFDTMKDDEKATYAKWRKDHCVKEGELERDFAAMMVRSVANTWEGFYEVSDVIHGDWGFNPALLDEAHYVGRPILLISSEGDQMTPDAMAKWLAASYKNSHYRSISGGHLASLYHINDIWKQFFDICDSHNVSDNN